MFYAEIETESGIKKRLDLLQGNELYESFTDNRNILLPFQLHIGKTEKVIKAELKSDNDFGNALVKILTKNKDTLYEAYKLKTQLMKIQDENIKECLEENLLNEQYETKEEIYEDIREMEKEFSEIRLDLYCPLVGEVIEEDGNSYFLDGEEVLDYEDEFRNLLEKEQRYITNMAEYVGEHAGLSEKLRFVEWDVEEKNNTLYGKISCYLNSSLTEEETERLKDAVMGQNSDGFGEGVEQRAIETSDGDLYVSLWHSGEDYFLYTKDEMNAFLEQKSDMQFAG